MLIIVISNEAIAIRYVKNFKTHTYDTISVHFSEAYKFQIIIGTNGYCNYQNEMIAIGMERRKCESPGAYKLYYMINEEVAC